MLANFGIVISLYFLPFLVESQLTGSVGPTSSISTKAKYKTCDVTQYGASSGDIYNDFGAALDSAWNACRSGGLVYIPPGDWYMQSFVQLGYASSTAIQLDGVIIRNGSANGEDMITIIGGNDVEFFSGNSQGAIQGYGYEFLRNQQYGPRLLRFQGLQDFSLHGIALVDSPSYYVVLDDVQNTEVYNMIVRGISVGETDAFDVSGSNVWVHDLEVTNGDECVTIKNTASNILIENIYCNISGGCSIGSLGLDTDISDITYRQIYCNQADPAFIKSNGGNGTAKNLLWDTVIVREGSYPLSIDSSWGSDSGEDGILFTNLTYNNWHGTGDSTRPVVRLDCPSENPCTDITLDGIYLWTSDGNSIILECDSSFGSGACMRYGTPESYSAQITETVAPAYSTATMPGDLSTPFPSTTAFEIPAVPTSFYPGARPYSALLSCDSAGCV